MATIAPRNTQDALLQFTPALSNFWDFRYGCLVDSGFSDAQQEMMENLTYLVTSIEIEGWSFKYDYIDAKQINVLTGVKRPTRITLTLSDTKEIGVLDSILTLINLNIFSKKDSTFRTGVLGKIIGQFDIRILDPYKKNTTTASAFIPIAEIDQNTSFQITCKDVHIGSTPQLILSRSESKPLSYSIDFYCDSILYASHILNIAPSPKSISDKEPSLKISTPATKAATNKQWLNPSFEKFLNISTPTFSNLFYVDFDFNADIGDLKNILRPGDRLFTDILIESVTIDGYNIDYTFSEALRKNLFSKIKRQISLSLSIIDNKDLPFLSAVYVILQKYYYCASEGYFINSSGGKNMVATFVLYETNLKTGRPEVTYIIYAEGIQIEKLPSLSLSYTNSDMIKYSINFVCDDITFLNKEDIAASSFVNKVI